MPIRLIRACFFVLTCLALTACTETIIREIPATDADDVADASDSETGNMTDQLGDPTSNNGIVTTLLSTPDDQTLVGDAGVDVDCEGTIPCRWSSSDSQFTVTVTNVDNIGNQDRLELFYTLQADHDTEVSIPGGGNALTSSGLSLLATIQMLGGSTAANTQTLLAGVNLLGSISFDKAGDSDSLSQWSIQVLDNGVAHTATFMNIPIGPLTTDFADCKQILPCVWETPLGDTTITLNTAGGYSSNNRLTVNFVVQTAATVDVAIDAGAMAISSTGTPLEGRTHTLNYETDYQKIVSESFANAGLTGSVDFFRTKATPVALHQLDLVLYQDNPVPRWNPRFYNIPIQ